MRPKFGAIPTDWIKSRGQMDQRGGRRRGGLFVSGGFLFLPAVNRVYGNRRTTQVLFLFPGSGLDGGRNLILTKLPAGGRDPPESTWDPPAVQSLKNCCSGTRVGPPTRFCCRPRLPDPDQVDTPPLKPLSHLYGSERRFPPQHPLKERDPDP